MVRDVSKVVQTSPSRPSDTIRASVCNVCICWGSIGRAFEKCLASREGGIETKYRNLNHNATAHRPSDWSQGRNQETKHRDVLHYDTAVLVVYPPTRSTTTRGHGTTRVHGTLPTDSSDTAVQVVPDGLRYVEVAPLA